MTPPYWNAVYYPNWHVYKERPPSSLRVSAITHIFYAFAQYVNSLKPDGTVHLSDPWSDSQISVDGVNGCLRACTKLRHENRYLRVILSIGGGAASENFALVAADDTSRARFIRTTRELIDEYNLDGIDVDWETPSTPSDSQNYTRLLIELRQVLPSPQYTLTTALSADVWALQNIQLASIAPIVDAIMLMAYDFSGPWIDTAKHHSALTDGMKGVQYCMQQGVPSSKLVLGIPCYGRSFLGFTGMNGKYEGHGGEEGTYEYRDLPLPGVQDVDDSDIAASCLVRCCEGSPDCGGRCGQRSEWVTYDNARSVCLKADWVRRSRLKGLFYWTGTGDSIDEGRSLVLEGYKILSYVAPNASRAW